MEMQAPGGEAWAIETAVERIYLREFHEMKPRTPLPGVRILFRQWANASANVRLLDGVLEVKISDAFLAAPHEVHEALARILLSKLYRRAVSAKDNETFRRYLNRRDMRTSLREMRRERGRKYVSGPQGDVYNLEAVFEDVNLRFFHGLMARPPLGWSRQKSRVTLGHYDPAHHAIILSRLLDDARVPRVVVEYVMYHEMLHLRFPEVHRNGKRCVHTGEFRAAEKLFPQLREAKDWLKRL